MIGLLWVAQAAAGELELGYNPNPGANEKPALVITAPRPVEELYISCDSGGKAYEWTRANVKAGAPQRFEFARVSGVTSATCYIRVRFVDGMAEEMEMPIEWSFSPPLKVDLTKVRGDVNKHTVTARVNAPVETAEIVAYGARKVELARTVVEVNAGPGDITLPWVGDPDEVVLLDYTLRSGGSWAGFTFSPWFLDIPHDDVLFETNSDVIPAAEEWKMQRTLEQLQEVLEKYGEIVPVKLYIAGCTDTVGDAAHNKDLSRRRAKAIATWLRAHGYDKPIYYYGFGEGLLAVPTGDGVDNAANRRVLYMVGSSPPPSGSGVPSVTWLEL